MSKHSPLIVRHRGSLSKTEEFLQRNFPKLLEMKLSKLGQKGVDALAAATPVRTGKTAASWRYVVSVNHDRVSIQWHNDNKTANGDNIVVLLVRGHGTRDGHYIRGRDFVTPAIQPIFDEIAEEAWAEVTK